MMNFAFRLLLTFNATSLLLITFTVKNGYTLDKFITLPQWLTALPNMISYLVYFSIPVLLTGISIILSSRLGKDDFKQDEIKSIEYADNSFLPSYLGYFFVALSIENDETLTFVYGVLFVFTFLSQALYFNPLFLLYNFKFYNVTTKNGAYIFLISKGNYKTPNEIIINKAFRINNHTFIERGD